jgi:hypothetical protein
MPGNGAPKSAWMRRHAPWLILVAASAALLARDARYGLLGYDCYPIIVTSRVRSLADFVGSFTEKLMDGRYPSDFYRPLINLTFAADEAVWGLHAFGYQLTNVLCFAACAWTVYLLARRLVGRDARVAPLVTLLVFLFNPLHAEVLPVPPRRPEILCCLFMALALVWQLSPRAMRARRPSVWPASATLLAIASKEAGFLLPLLVFAAVYLYSEREALLARICQAALATLPHLAAVAMMILARVIVIGDMGGHMKVSAGDLPGNIAATLGFVGEGLLLPQIPMRNFAGVALVVMIPAIMLATVALRGRAKTPDDAGRRTNRATAVAAVWLLVVVLTYAAAGVIGAWYYPIPVAGWAILVGALAERFVCLGRDTGLVRTGAMASLTLLGILIVWQGLYSPIVHRYREWTRATEASSAFLDQTREIVAAAAKGTVVEAPPLPVWVAPEPGGPGILGAVVLDDYSVQAWADLTMPGKNVTVRSATAAYDPPGPDQILLLITRRRVRY